ncbi:MAG: hypothetical protein MJH09_13250 [Cetobacterium sp.]|nr:hypothetical protein [Cetobacterium sp.]
MNQMLSSTLKAEQILNISDKRYFDNLKAYTILKNLIQLKLTQKQNNILFELLSLFKNIEINKFKKDFEEKILDDKSLNSKKERIIEVFLPELLVDEDKNLFALLLKLLLFKDYILSLAKMYENKTVLSINPETDSSYLLSFKYDSSTLYKPYSVRVAGSLLIKYAFLKDKEIIKGTFLENIYNEFSHLKHHYSIDSDILLQIIFNESASQSAKSTGGYSYEKRLELYLQSKEFKLLGKTHDSKNSAVEYDNVIQLDTGERIGISSKRTLRERYKQNHENVDELDIDLMLVITLGNDLNVEKLLNITSKKGTIVFIADDIYQSKLKDFENTKCYQISLLSIEFLKDILNKGK